MEALMPGEICIAVAPGDHRTLAAPHTYPVSDLVVMTQNVFTNSVWGTGFAWFRHTVGVFASNISLVWVIKYFGPPPFKLVGP